MFTQISQIFYKICETFYKIEACEIFDSSVTGGWSGVISIPSTLGGENKDLNGAYIYIHTYTHTYIHIHTYIDTYIK